MIDVMDVNSYIFLFSWAIRWEGGGEVLSCESTVDTINKNTIRTSTNREGKKHIVCECTSIDATRSAQSNPFICPKTSYSGL